MTKQNETGKSKKTKTSWEPKKTVMRDLQKGDTTPWEPKRSVMKSLEETYRPRKNKKSES